MDDAGIRIGISSCLLGHEVRFDGGHKRDRYVVDTLGEHFDWVAVCPEVELGLGTPRETIRLVQLGGGVKLRSTNTEVDLTEDMENYAKRRVAKLIDADLSGYILKRGSPSCGMQRVKVRQPQGSTKRNGRGVFAAALLSRLPNLPVEEESRLYDPRLRENWVERVFAYRALQDCWRRRWRISDLADFHTRCKFQLLAHSETEYREMDRLLAAAKSLRRNRLRDQYETQFMAVMKRVATVRKHVNVLKRMLAVFKKQLDAAARDELMAHIEDYQRGLVPLVIPLMLIRHYARVLDIGCLREQWYLNPHPKELALRNHV